MDYESGQFGRGGQRECAVELVFRGTLGEPFVAFAVARARRLSLRGWIEPDARTVRVCAQGPEALVDAFEVACSLGPVQSNVDAWSRLDRDTDIGTAGFERLA